MFGSADGCEDMQERGVDWNETSILTAACRICSTFVVHKDSAIE